jgi:hypothetical protein
MMLARLRMPVDDCIEEYSNLAGGVFGKPRAIHAMTLVGAVPGLNRTKYDTNKLESAIKDVFRRRGEEAVDSDDMMRFQTPTGLCRA